MKSTRGKRAIGAKEHRWHILKTKKLTRKEAILAKCFECLCGYKNGKLDCEIPGCPLYPYMPYRSQN